MKRIKGFFSTKGFYIALSVGVFAFAALMVAGDLRETREEMEKEQIVDLNEPADQIADSTDATKEAEDDTNKTEKTTETNSPSAVADVKEEDDDEAPVTEESIQEETVLTNSDGAEAEEAPDIVFDEERSLLWPVMGNVILPYSMDTTVYFQTLDVYKCNPAILIQAEEGTNVTAACNGIVKDITETREFGTMVVVDLGSGYEATYGQVMNVCVNVGDRVSESQNIAEIAPASSYYSEEGNHLYFAITKDGVPVDPMSLIQ